ncbi:ATP-binding cassette domain-containing protein [Rhizobium sp. G187]|uniref:ATP-binding cassette domain-containing protein n=1 Tax=Rhizobium sp. G187 TaxID=3451352 RepID=UPI003EE6EFF9
MLLSIDGFGIAFRRYDGLLHHRVVPALEAVSFTIDRGQVLGLVGASGAGKSLVAHALFGILPPNAVLTGSISIGGIEIGALGAEKLNGCRMGLVPQSPSHLDPLVRCGRQLAWAATRSGHELPKAAIGTLLESFGLEAAVARLYPHQLSGGMARRLMLAMATVGEPDLIVADEPTSGLDPDNAAIVLRRLRRLADAGKAVLLITHDLAHALPYTDRVALLRDGGLVGIEDARAFSGDGSRLETPYARHLWRAMPQNEFQLETAAYARSA